MFGQKHIKAGTWAGLWAGARTGAKKELRARAMIGAGAELGGAEERARAE